MANRSHTERSAGSRTRGSSLTEPIRTLWFRYTVKELTDANLDLIAPKLRRAFFVGVGSGLIALIAGMALKNQSLQLAALLLTATGVFPPLFARSFQIPMYLKRKVNKPFYEERSCQISEEGLEWELAKGESSPIAWERFIKGKELLFGYVLYTSEAQFYLLPKRVFRSEEDWNRFRELAREKLAQASTNSAIGNGQDSQG